MAARNPPGVSASLRMLPEAVVWLCSTPPHLSWGIRWWLMVVSWRSDASGILPAGMGLTMMGREQREGEIEGWRDGGMRDGKEREENRR